VFGHYRHRHDPLRQTRGFALRTQISAGRRIDTLNVSAIAASALNSHSPARRTSCSANALSLPLDHEISAFGATRPDDAREMEVNGRLPAWLIGGGAAALLRRPSIPVEPAGADPPCAPPRRARLS
jgi:hypothetical protein